MSRRILHGNPLLRLCVHRIEDSQEQPFQWLHEKVYRVRSIGRADVPGQGKAVFVVKAADGAVEPGKPLLQNLLKGIGNAELAVHNHRMAAACAHAQGLYKPAATVQR